MEYQYSLDKSSKKFICPLCEKKRFVKYINLNSNEYINDVLGRCDRETSCGYHKKPSTNSSVVYTPYISEKVVTPSFHSFDLIEKSSKKYDTNKLILFLSIYFSEVQILNVITKYNIGTSKHWDGATLFWQIDQQKNVCAGKVILFNEITGKRVKEPYPHINWIHKITKQTDFKLQQSLFGLHLVAKQLQPSSKRLQQTIAIVESEKTAIIMSLFLPEYIWLATGSKQNFKYDLLQPLRNEKIIVFPDKGEFEDWNIKSSQLNKMGFKIS
jgi:hypothetical protein